MYQNQQMQQKAQHQQISCRPISSPSSTTLFKLSYLVQRLQKQTIFEYAKHHRNHQHNQHNQHHRQKHKAKRHFARCGLAFFIFLSVIKDSLTTTYSTSLDATTTPPQTNVLPYFDFDVPRNMTVTVGQTGFLHCRVERLGDKDVSWIRKRDLHILTAGSTTYTSDQRFQVLRPENSGNWTLQIKYPQPRDSGIYECQINTEPKMSLSYTFNVVELKATIVGPTDLYVKSGSDINLTCRIIQGPHELGNIFWYKGSEIIDMAANQNEVDSGTRMSVENDWSDGLTSRLKIRRASSSDTGNYTCVPTIAKSSSVYVHVIIGEHPAAMQHNGSSHSCGNFYTSLCCILFTILTCFLQHLLCTGTTNVNMAKITTITTTLATKRASAGGVSMSMANKTDAATLQSASLSSSPSPSSSPLSSTSKTKPTIAMVSAVTTSKISQSKPHISSLESHKRKAKQFTSPSVTSTVLAPIPAPAADAETSPTAGVAAFKILSSLSFTNGGISR